MRLPFVSRRRYEHELDRVRGLEESVRVISDGKNLLFHNHEKLQSRFDQLLDKYSQLVDQVVKMKNDGFELPVELPDIELAEIAPEVRAAILERAVPGTRTYRELHGWAVEQARVNISTPEIVNSILKGGEY